MRGIVPEIMPIRYGYLVMMCVNITTCPTKSLCFFSPPALEAVTVISQEIFLFTHTCTYALIIMIISTRL